MKNKIVTILTCVSVLMCGSGSTIYAMTETSVLNNFETGIVDIDLTEYQKSDDGTETTWVDNPVVLPGSDISKIPRIHNYGNDCYVRAKLSFLDTESVDEEDLYGMTSDWVSCEDGYYYYTNVLKTEQDVDLFQGVLIPCDLPEETQDSQFSLKIDVDAIQSKNFTPDFTSHKPWGDVEIQDCLKEGEYDITTFKTIGTQSLQVVYEGDSKKLLSSPDDFFTNFPYIMPGDSYSDSVNLKNDSSSNINLYFRSEGSDTNDLLDKITLHIDTEIAGKTTTVYEGPLRGTDLSQNKLLGTIPKGKSGTFRFSIIVPPELDNRYTILSSFVKWYFSTELVSETTAKNPGATASNGTTTYPSGSGTSQLASTGTSSLAKQVKTGDASSIGIYLILAGLSFGTAAAVLYKKEKKEGSR